MFVCLHTQTHTHILINSKISYQKLMESPGKKWKNCRISKNWTIKKHNKTRLHLPEPMRYSLCEPPGWWNQCCYSHSLFAHHQWGLTFTVPCSLYQSQDVVKDVKDEDAWHPSSGPCHLNKCTQTCTFAINMGNWARTKKPHRNTPLCAVIPPTWPHGASQGAKAPSRAQTPPAILWKWTAANTTLKNWFLVSPLHQFCILVRKTRNPSSGFAQGRRGPCRNCANGKGWQMLGSLVLLTKKTEIFSEAQQLTTFVGATGEALVDWPSQNSKHHPPTHPPTTTFFVNYFSTCQRPLIGQGNLVGPSDHGSNPVICLNHMGDGQAEF